VAEFCTTACFIHSSLEYYSFLNTDISQGSVVTQLRCGGIVNEDFVTNLVVKLSVKELWKLVNIWRSNGKDYSGLFFIDSQCRWSGNFRQRIAYLTYKLEINDAHLQLSCCAAALFIALMLVGWQRWHLACKNINSQFSQSFSFGEPCLLRSSSSSSSHMSTLTVAATTFILLFDTWRSVAVVWCVL